MELESSRPVGVRTLAHFARRRLANNLREQGAAQGVTALLGGWDEVSACYTFGAQYVSAVVVIGPCGGDWGTIFTAREHRTRHVKVVACSLSALLMQSCSNARFTRCRIHITGLIALGRSQSTVDQLDHLSTVHDLSTVDHLPTVDHLSTGDYISTVDHLSTVDHQSTVDHLSTGDRLSTVDHQSTVDHLSIVDHLSTGHHLSTGDHLYTRDRLSTVVDHLSTVGHLSTGDHLDHLDPILAAMGCRSKVVPIL